MNEPISAVWRVFGTSRGLRIFAANIFIAFGLISGLIQFIGQLYSWKFPRPGLVTLGSLGICFLWGMIRAYPRQHSKRDFGYPDMTVAIAVGDLFDQNAHLVIGFSDTFDTSVSGDRIISKDSVQGQLLERFYAGDQRRLDNDLALALDHVRPIWTETSETKPEGNLDRYPIGTVVTLGQDRRIFAVAYSRMGNDLVAKAGVEDLWFSLGRLWDAVYQHGQRGSVAMPLVGSGLARVDVLDRESLIKMILLSFVARSRQELICRELRIIVWPPDFEKIDILELNAFLYAL